MRREASIQEWKELYDVGMQIKALAPLILLKDLDFVAIEDEEEYYILEEEGGTQRPVKTSEKTDHPKAKDAASGGKIIDFSQKQKEKAKDVPLEPPNTRAGEEKRMSINKKESGRYADPPWIGGLGDNDIFFAKALGENGILYGMSLYQGGIGFTNIQRVLKLSEAAMESGDPFEADRAMREQNFFSMRFGNREDVPKEQYQVIRQLGLKFRGKGQWLFFEAKKKNFSYWILDKAEVWMMTRILQGYLEVLQALQKEEKDDVGQGSILFQRKNPASGKKEIVHAHPIVLSVSHPKLKIMNDKLLAEMKARPGAKTILELDVIYPREAVIGEPDFDRPAEIRIAVMAENKSGFILEAIALLPNEGEGQIMMDMVMTL